MRLQKIRVAMCSNGVQTWEHLGRVWSEEGNPCPFRSIENLEDYINDWDEGNYICTAHKTKKDKYRVIRRNVAEGTYQGKFELRKLKPCWCQITSINL